MEFQTLNNGIKIPVLGFGVWQIFNQKEWFGPNRGDDTEPYKR